jgi:hypothetical protein
MDVDDCMIYELEQECSSFKLATSGIVHSLIGRLTLSQAR